jgi:dTDP-glucose pyrophosphorylase
MLNEDKTLLAKPVKVLITTSGTGSRVGNFTKYTNKSLIPIGDKPAISYIIESYPPETEFVITLGHFGDLVRDFLLIAYSNLNFEFIKIENYGGEGSSLGYSMLQASKSLQCPFIFHASDTLIRDQEIPAPDQNWVAGYKGNDATQYTSFDSAGGILIHTHAKGMDSFDYLHIGLVGVFSYEKFWEELRILHRNDPLNSELNDLRVIHNMVSAGHNFSVIEFKNWDDVGSMSGLNSSRAKADAKLSSLEKMDESIFGIGNEIIKFFSNKQVCSSRIKRSSILFPAVPKVIESAENFYKYEFVKGKVSSKELTLGGFKNLLNWAETSIWNRDIPSINKDKFNQVCKEFYYDKSIARIKLFFEKSGFTDSVSIINGKKIPHIFDIFLLIEETGIFDGQQSLIHGDFILDNIIQTESGFMAIDWRQDFGGLLEIGDLYYDLAKINHSLALNHELLNKNEFRIKIEKKLIEVDVLRWDSFLDCEFFLKEFVISRNLDYKKIRIITAIIWVNMAALHSHPLDLFLFNYGKYKLWRSLSDSTQ